MASNNLTEQILTFKYALRPRKRQYETLEAVSEQQRQIYNACLESRVDFYRKTGKTLSYFDQAKQMTELRKEQEFSALPVKLHRATLQRIDRAFKGFFSRIKRGKKAGFPRFKSRNRWSGFGFSEFSGITLKDDKLSFKGMNGKLHVHMHRPMPQSKILSCQFVKDVKGWHVCFQVRVPIAPLEPTGRSIGIDVGLKDFVVASSGEKISNPRHFRKHERELRRRQRHMARCKKGSNGRKKAREAVARVHLKIKNARSTFLHQASARLVRENDLIAIEDLNVKGLSSGMLAKSVNDAGLAQFSEYLAYKAVKAGRELVKVDPRYTTQACSGCGVIVPKKLSDRWHLCPECGSSLDRDHNAALNILGRSGSTLAQRKEMSYAC